MWLILLYSRCLDLLTEPQKSASPKWKCPLFIRYSSQNMPLHSVKLSNITMCVCRKYVEKTVHRLRKTNVWKLALPDINRKLTGNFPLTSTKDVYTDYHNHPTRSGEHN